MREVHSGREVYKVLIDLRLMAGVCSLEVYEVEIEGCAGLCWMAACLRRVFINTAVSSIFTLFFE